MKILVVVSCYKPDGGASATLYPQLCEELVKLGHKVVVLTTVPHYPSGRVPDEYHNWSSRSSDENGVKVIRIGLPSVNRSNLIARLFQFILFQLGAVWVGMRQKYDILLTHTPALEVFLPFIYFSVLRRKPTIYSVHDLYPDVGIKLGIFRNGLLIKVVEWLERYCMDRAQGVRILSKSFKVNLQNKGTADSKLALIYDWVDIQEVRPLPKNNNFARENDLDKHFVILYAGNIGLVQGLDTVIETANLLVDDTEICFAFVGDGAGRNALEKKVEQLGLKNIRFIPYQPRERMPEVYAVADISLVTLRKGTGFGALPSKTFQILSSGRPLIASLDKGSDTWDLVSNAKAGLCIPPEDPSELVKAILLLKQNQSLREQLGHNGRTWAMQHHSPQAAAKQFEQLFLMAESSKRLKSSISLSS